MITFAPSITIDGADALPAGIDLVDLIRPLSALDRLVPIDRLVLERADPASAARWNYRVTPRDPLRSTWNQVLTLDPDVGMFMTHATGGKGAGFTPEEVAAQRALREFCVSLIERMSFVKLVCTYPKRG